MQIKIIKAHEHKAFILTTVFLITLYGCESWTVKKAPQEKNLFIRTVVFKVTDSENHNEQLTTDNNKASCTLGKEFCLFGEESSFLLEALFTFPFVNWAKQPLAPKAAGPQL